MKRSHAWFENHAKAIWTASPGRSITCLVPSGCADLSRLPGFIEGFIRGSFEPPRVFSQHILLVIRLVPDHSTSAAKIVSRFRQRAAFLTKTDFAADDNMDPGEALDEIVKNLCHNGYYVVLIIERFQSFARLADDATVSLLSQLRTLEHEFHLTSIIISNQSCAVLRKRLPVGLPFLNSSYGDNHDQAVMPSLTSEEFVASAPHICPEISAEIFKLGSGPDTIFQILLDEYPRGLDGLEERSWVRARHLLDAFLLELFGSVGELEEIILRAAACRNLNPNQSALLRSLPHAEFIFNLGKMEQSSLKGTLAHRFVRDMSSTLSSTRNHAMRLLICSANPDFDLDLEKEVRAIKKVADAVARRERVVIEAIGAVTPDDLLAILRRFKPTAIHFSGHGCENGIVMRGDSSETHTVSGPALATLLRGRGVDLVVLNSCFSASQADSISAMVGVVIGTMQEVQDEAAIRFSTAFYRTLLDGETVEAAFRDGKDVLALYNLVDVYSSRGNLEIFTCNN